jgi:hypothetical protein
MVPHVGARKTHQRLSEFSFDTPKRLLQQYLPIAEMAGIINHLIGWLRVRGRVASERNGVVLAT